MQTSPNFSTGEEMVTYPLDRTYTYKGAFYHPGDRIPASMAENLRRRAESRKAVRRLSRLETPSTAKVDMGEDDPVNADETQLPAGFPGLAALADQGITRVGDLKTVVGDLESIAGIGETTAGKIRETLELMQKEGQA